MHIFACCSCGEVLPQRYLESCKNIRLDRHHRGAPLLPVSFPVRFLWAVDCEIAFGQDVRRVMYHHEINSSRYLAQYTGTIRHIYRQCSLEIR